jgi:hypothetical protein
MLFIVSSAVFAQPPSSQMPPRLPVSKMSQELNVSSSELVSCLQASRPDQSQPPSREQHEAMKATLLSCLQKSNDSLTSDQLDEVMKKYRPPRQDNNQPKPNSNDFISSDSSSSF